MERNLILDLANVERGKISFRSKKDFPLKKFDPLQVW